MSGTVNAGTGNAGTGNAGTGNAGTGETDIGKMPFEAAMKELETIVDRLEKGQVALEESITIYERGEALKAHCDALLKSAEARIEKITLSRDGKPTGTGPLDVA